MATPPGPPSPCNNYQAEGGGAIAQEGLILLRYLNSARTMFKVLQQLSDDLQRHEATWKRLSEEFKRLSDGM